MKYNNENEWKAIKHDYFVKVNQRFMQEKLSFYHPYTNEKLFIPKNTIFDKVGKIATGNEIMDVKRLVNSYGGEKEDWLKRYADIITDKRKFQVHYYELNKIQYDLKIKVVKEIENNNTKV